MDLKKKYKLVEGGGCRNCCFVDKENVWCEIACFPVDEQELNTQVGDCADYFGGGYAEIEAENNKRSVSIETLEELKNLMDMACFECKDEKLDRAINIINELIGTEDNVGASDNYELKCKECGTTEGVKETICPYNKEINDIEIHVFLCDECYYERCMDI